MHPPIEPFAHGSLVRPDGAAIHWETSGNPTGKPALYLHGGPGSGLGLGDYRRRFDPDRHLIVGIDQRGCGRSTPWAIDDLERLETNTTHELIADIEAVREMLGVERWLVHGASWGSTLALAYALECPDAVSELVLTAVTSGSRAEIDWISDGVGVLFPEAHERLMSGVNAGERGIESLARRLRDPNPAVRSSAALAWEEWETTHVSLDPGFTPGPLFDDDRARENFATLVTHYWAHDCFLPTGQSVLERVDELADVPAVLIHGRHDVSSPVGTAWRLHRAWPASRLHIVETEGHGGPEEMELTMTAIDGFLPAPE
ncbi:prolyl aminopeptidase [Labedella populi]|uniref:Proline iminopeptidase n=1 Tax=Labedella populi TaxID=2498850 RepID=A0A444QBJ6_9MICO|nr:prolyl aminopeptidase [Labedella populi]RWZ61371.1 prolyl aminopeptidase [Labedella populi]